MSKKNQVYLSAFLMYLVAGLAGYINDFASYWMVLLISGLITVYTMLNAFSKEENVSSETKVDWISVCAFFGLEVIITLCVCVWGVSYVGFFKYFNYAVQILGLLFAIYAIIKYVIANTSYYETIKNKISTSKQDKHEIVVMEETKNSQVVEKVEEVIAQETHKEELHEELDDIDIVEQNSNNESEVIEIECKKEEEVVTPYMEEEI